MRVDSEVIFEQKESTTSKLTSEAEEIFVNRKTRQQVLDQIMRKVRWRYSPDGELESNAKFATWENGTYGVYVGNDYYELSGQSHSNEVLHCMQDKLMLLQGQIRYTAVLKARQEALKI